MAVTEPTTGSDTTRLKTFAELKGDRYVVNGQKVWTSRVQHSDYLLLLARTTPLAEVKKRSEGLSVFLVDLRQAIGKGIELRPIRNMVNHETNELFIDNLEIPVENRIGEEGKGLKYILDGLNAERILIAAECIGDGYWFVEKASRYASERVVFERPIGKNQGVQFPIAKSYASVEAASLMRYRAAEHVQAAGGRRIMGSRQRLSANARRLWFRGRVRRRAQIPRNASLSGCAHLHQHDPVLHRRARAGHAPFVLITDSAHGRFLRLDRPFARRDRIDRCASGALACRHAGTV
jgi:alkylation response protein AidB-like acyl-CoA dehydrogenase